MTPGMSFTDQLPDRPLRFSEFQALQRNENIDELYADDSPGPIGMIEVVIGETRAAYHYHEGEGWHRMENE